MSQLGPLRHALITRVAALPTLATSQVLAVPPGENQSLKESVWVARGEQRFEWRGLGTVHPPIEHLTLVVNVECYTEGPDHLDAAELIVARCETITSAIATAVHAEPSFSAVVDWCRLANCVITPHPAESGWSAVGVLTFDAHHHPPTP